MGDFHKFQRRKPGAVWFAIALSISAHKVDTMLLSDAMTDHYSFQKFGTPECSQYNSRTGSEWLRRMK